MKTYADPAFGVFRSVSGGGGSSPPSPVAIPVNAGPQSSSAAAEAVILADAFRAPISGDTYLDTAGPGVSLLSYDGAVWVPSIVFFAGTAGQEWADLPANPPDDAVARVGNRLYYALSGGWVLSTNPGASIDWGSAAGDTAVGNQIYVFGIGPVTGDLYTDTTATGTQVKKWSGSAWQPYLVTYTGAAGQQFADLPTGCATGALATVGTLAYYWTGAAWAGQPINPFATISGAAGTTAAIISINYAAGTFGRVTLP